MGKLSEKARMHQKFLHERERVKKHYPEAEAYFPKTRTTSEILKGKESISAERAQVTKKYVDLSKKLENTPYKDWPKVN